MNCNKCKDECTCTSKDCTPVDAKCVVYNSDGSPSQLTCIADIPSGTTLNKILEIWDEYFCGIFTSTILDCVKDRLQIPTDTVTLSNSRLLTYIQNWICNLEDVNVKTSPNDATSGYLFDKITVGDCIKKEIKIEENLSQSVHLSLDFGCIAAQIPLCFTIEPQPCFEIDCTSCGGGQCTPQATIPVISRTLLTLTGTNCNGSLQWFNSQDIFVGTGNTIAVESNKSYYAKCQTACGQSDKSNVIDVPVVNTYTKTRVADFRRNNCGINSCNVACSGSSITFTKTYTSNISQADADAKSETDTTFAADGQTYANTMGICVCSDCNCTFPTYNPTVIVNNATCSGSVISATGQITIGGIANADKFGYSIGAGDYSGVSYASATSLTNFASSNIETTPTTIKLKALSLETRIVFRLYNGSNTCYTDIVVLLTPPDCTREQVNIGDITVNCEIPDTTCHSYSIQAGSIVGKYVYQNCLTGEYVFESLAINGSVTRCSRVIPQVTNAIATNIGNC